MTLRHALLTALFALPLAAAAPVQAEPGLAGEWKGVADGHMSFTMRFAEEDGAFVGTLDIPAQGIQGARVEAKAEGDGLTGRFTLADGTEGTFAGKWADGGGYAGTYEQPGASGSFEMKKAE